MVEESQHEETHLYQVWYFVANAGENGTSEKGDQYLTMLESTKIELINLYKNPFSKGTDM